METVFWYILIFDAMTIYGFWKWRSEFFTAFWGLCLAGLLLYGGVDLSSSIAQTIVIVLVWWACHKWGFKFLIVALLSIIVAIMLGFTSIFFYVISALAPMIP